MACNLESPQPVLVAGLFPHVLESLLHLLLGLTEDEWDLPTACAGWSVKDVAIHLLGVEIGNLSARRDGHRIRAQAHKGDELAQTIQDWNQQWVSAARRMSARLLIDLFQLTGSQMADYVQSLDPFAMGGPVIWAGDDPAPVWLDIAREYTERWHHQQHIRDAVGRVGLKEPTFMAPALATFVHAMPHTYRGVDAPSGTAIALHIDGPSGGTWTILREDGAWQLYAGRPATPTARVEIAEDYAWKLFTNGLSEEQARAHTNVYGDIKLAAPMLQMVAIIA
jgi:uncharacterized protein (TIGR03083 family)